MKETELTRQGVRNLNNVGVRPRTMQPKLWTCPPHLPADQWEHDRTGAMTVSVLRCRSCRKVIDSEVDW